MAAGDGTNAYPAPALRAPEPNGTSVSVADLLADAFRRESAKRPTLEPYLQCGMLTTNEARMLMGVWSETYASLSFLVDPLQFGEDLQLVDRRRDC